MPAQFTVGSAIGASAAITGLNNGAKRNSSGSTPGDPQESEGLTRLQDIRQERAWQSCQRVNCR